MNEQQLMKTIEDQNQVIIAKDATIDNLRKDLKNAIAVSTGDGVTSEPKFTFV